MNRIMKNFFMCLLLVSIATLTGCAGMNGGPFVNSVETERIIVAPNGQTLREVQVQRHDMSGTVAANTAGNVVGILSNAANAGVATNFGKGYPRNRQILHNMTYPTGLWNTSNNWGNNYNTYGGVSYVPRGGILVQ